MNKKAGEKLMAVWWFFVLAVIAGGVITGVLIFYSADYEVSNVETELLYGKVLDCFVKNGIIQQDLFKDEFNDKVLELCSLNKAQFAKGSDFYFRVSLYNEEISLISEHKEGDFSFEKDCEIVLNGVDAQYYPRCAKRRNVFINDNNGIEKKYILDILTASNQKGERITSLN